MISDMVDGPLGRRFRFTSAGFVDNIEALPHRAQPALRRRRCCRRFSRCRTSPGVTGRILFSGLVSNGVRRRRCSSAAGSTWRTRTRPAPTREPGERRAAAAGAGRPRRDGARLRAGARRFGLKLGKLASTCRRPAPAGRANSMDLHGEGASTSSFPFENKRVVTVPLSTAQELLGLEGRVTEYAVAVDDLGPARRGARPSCRRRWGPSYEVHTWQRAAALRARPHQPAELRARDDRARPLRGRAHRHHQHHADERLRAGARDRHAARGGRAAPPGAELFMLEAATSSGCSAACWARAVGGAHRAGASPRRAASPSSSPAPRARRCCGPGHAGPSPSSAVAVGGAGRGAGRGACPPGARRG